MATDNQGQDLSFKAAGDESAEQFTFYKLDTAGRADQCTANDGTDGVVGILQNKPGATDRSARIRVSGKSKLVASTTINEGDRLRPDATGRGVATTTDTHCYGAVALTAATATDDKIEVLVTPYALHTG